MSALAESSSLRPPEAEKAHSDHLVLARAFSWAHSQGTNLRPSTCKDGLSSIPYQCPGSYLYDWSTQGVSQLNVRMGCAGTCGHLEGSRKLLHGRVLCGLTHPMCPAWKSFSQNAGRKDRHELLPCVLFYSLPIGGEKNTLHRENRLLQTNPIAPWPNVLSCSGC